jgi:hypothetical protein
MTTQNTLEVANTILAQLGGRRFITMTGSSNFTGRADGLSFKVGRGPKGITHVRITLTPADDYTVEFLKVRGSKVTTAHTAEGIYCDQLEEVFTDNTGLFTRI